MSHQLYEYSFTALGCKNEIKLFAENSTQATDASDRIIKECRRIEAKFSRYKPDSIITKINKSASQVSVTVDEETAGLLDYASACFSQSDGLFDITSGILRNVWNFKEKIVPSSNSIEEILPLIGWDKVKWHNHTIFFPLNGMEIDLGGIGKEYAVDRCYGVALECGIQHGFVNLGGDLRIIGPRPDGSPWHIGIQHSQKANSTAANVKLKSGALATSGDYERYIELDGTRYCHILNPKTGWPVQGLHSVSVMADSCLIAGTLATIAMLFGKERGRNFLEEQGVTFLLH